MGVTGQFDSLSLALYACQEKMQVFSSTILLIRRYVLQAIVFMRWMLHSDPPRFMFENMSSSLMVSQKYIMCSYFMKQVLGIHIFYFLTFSLSLSWKAKYFQKMGVHFFQNFSFPISHIFVPVPFPSGLGKGQKKITLVPRPSSLLSLLSKAGPKTAREKEIGWS